MSKPTLILCAFVLFLGCAATPISSDVTSLQSRGLIDYVLSTFGLQDVWDLIQHVGINATAPLLEMLTQIMFQGQTAISQAKAVVTKLVSTLKSSTVGGAQAVAQAVSDLAAIIAGNPNSKALLDIRVLLENHRGLLDYALNLFGLSDVWSSIQSMGAGVASQFLNDLIAIILKGKDAIDLAKPILAKMVQDLKDHGVGQFQIVFQTISDLTAIIAGNPNQKPERAMIETNRGLFDYVINLFGLSDEWTAIQWVGADYVAKLLNELVQIMLKGKGAIDLAKPILANMIQEIKDHSVGKVQAVAQAISDLAAILAGNPNEKQTRALIETNRGLFDYVINLFGLSDVWSSVQGAGVGLVANLMNELVQIMLKGKGAIDLAKPILANMIQEIKDHSVGKVQAVAQAISDLAAILAGNPNSRALLVSNRGILDYVINFFGLGDIWTTIQSAGSGLVATLLNELLQVMMKGKEFADQAKPIIARLVEELKGHSMTAVQAVTEAVSDLAAILAGKPPQ